MLGCVPGPPLPALPPGCNRMPARAYGREPCARSCPSSPAPKSLPSRCTCAGASSSRAPPSSPAPPRWWAPGCSCSATGPPVAAAPRCRPLPGEAPKVVRPRGPYDTDEKPTSYEDVTTYNNFYEFGLDKDDPRANAHTLQTRPWTISVEGEVRQAADDRHRHLLSVVPARGARLPHALRRGLVDGHPVAGLPAGRPDQARWSRPATRSSWSSPRCSIPSRCPASARAVLDWPYVEGLRLDEAMHPLDADGGRPVRQACCPTRTARRCGWWCRGSTASRASSRSSDHASPTTQPQTTWSLAARDEYGFYANVNPDGRPSALEPGHRAPHRRASRAARRCRSTATPSRWPASTPAWTCAATSDAAWPRLRTPGSSRPSSWAASLRWPSWCSGSSRARWAPTPSSTRSIRRGCSPSSSWWPRSRARRSRPWPDGRGPCALRKTLGLLGFAYACAALPHVLPCCDQGLALGTILEDIAKRPFITVGFLALVLLVPLAVTSTNRMVRRWAFPPGSGCTGWPTWRPRWGWCTSSGA